MRLRNIDGVEPGTFVIADAWERITSIGPSFECLMLTFRPKAIAVDYEKQKIETILDLKSPRFREIHDKALEAYNPTKGYFWGGDLLVAVEQQTFTWFFCTPNLRAMLPSIVFRARYVITSELIKTMSGGFWKPKLRMIEEKSNVSRYMELMKEFNNG